MGLHGLTAHHLLAVLVRTVLLVIAARDAGVLALFRSPVSRRTYISLA